MIEAFLAQNALLAALAGLLMATLLPGLPAWRIAGAAPGALAWPAVFALSLVANFQLVFYLTLGGALRVEVLACLGLLWLAGSAALLAMRRGASDPGLPAGAPAPAVAVPGPGALNILLAGLAAVATAALLLRLASALPSVFEAWDAVVSWNRWAQDWHRGALPRNTYGYPQLVPAAWATTYLWLGSARIELVAKGLMALFPLAVSAVFLDCYIRLRAPAALFALAAWPLALLRIFPDLVDSGYVDVPVAFFILLTAYLLFLGHAQHLRRGRAWLLAAVCAAGAVLTKQAGWLALVLLLGALAAGRRSAGPSWRGDAARAAAAFVLLAGPALAWQQLALWAGRDPSNFTYVTSTIYAGETPAGRLWRAVAVDTPQALQGLLPAPAGALLVLALLASALRLPEGRRLWLAAVLPYYLVWALFFSYDLRNLMPVVPLACLGLGLGVQALAGMRWHRQGARAIPAARAPNARPALVPAAVTLALLAALLPRVTREDLVRLSEARRLQSGDPEINRVLLDHFRGRPADGKLFTTYAPVAGIEELRARLFFHPDQPWLSAELVAAMKQMRPICHIIGLIPRHEEIRYLLLHAGVLPGVIDQALARGDLRLLHASAQLRFMEIVCPAGRT